MESRNLPSFSQAAETELVIEVFKGQLVVVIPSGQVLLSVIFKDQ